MERNDLRYYINEIINRRNNGLSSHQGNNHYSENQRNDNGYYDNGLSSHDEDRLSRTDRQWLLDNHHHYHHYNHHHCHTMTDFSTNQDSHDRNNNSQHSPRTSSLVDTETNRSSDFIIPIEVDIYLHSIGFIGDEETIIFDNIYQLLDEDEGEELNHECDAAFNYEDTMISNDINPLVEEEEEEEEEAEGEELIDHDSYMITLNYEDTMMYDDTYQSIDEELYVAINYEDLLTMQQLLGRVNSRLSEECISRHLKTRIHMTLVDKDEEYEICVVCQDEYENNEIIGILQCGHEYHVDCIKKWLLENSNCPICRATALVED